MAAQMKQDSEGIGGSPRRDMAVAEECGELSTGPDIHNQGEAAEDGELEEVGSAVSLAARSFIHLSTTGGRR
jgi:hypothetical protein